MSLYHPIFIAIKKSGLMEKKSVVHCVRIRFQSI